MKLQFVKMEGCGNDFLMIDSIRGRSINDLNKAQVTQICDRHLGVGADGLVLLHEGGEGVTARWKFYNADGSEAGMCGNAARCAIVYLADRHFPRERVISIMTQAGLVKGKKLGANYAEVAMVSKKNPDFRFDDKLLAVEGHGTVRTYVIDTGVPHAVVEVENLGAYPLIEVGQSLRRNPHFGREGTNVTFFQKTTGNVIRATTFERGVEDETLACGTGAVAAANIFSETYLQALPITVQVPGGEMVVDVSPVSKTMLLRGPANYVFEGEFPLGEKAYTPSRLYSRKREVPLEV
ncbi:MAG: diaminopimelate epimerase [Deltaproteobacteria bacterium]|nr:diaminopimelate epimerase [Deltaproteobacteria bacterium]MBI3294859.1 diaminopimelate epimerase [Deltaproteobacteria bacterium]